MSKEKIIVNSWNEWDPLKHVIVGKADGTCIPAPEPALDAKVPEDSDMRGQFGPRTKDAVDKANQLLDDFANILKKKGIKFKNTIKGNIPVGLNNVIMDLKKRFANEEPNWATRKSSQEVLESINPIIETTIGGSADLTGSNNTKTKDLGVLSKDNFQGRFIHKSPIWLMINHHQL